MGKAGFMSKRRFEKCDEDTVLISVSKETLWVLDDLVSGKEKSISRLKEISDRLASAIKWSIK